MLSKTLLIIGCSILSTVTLFALGWLLYGIGENFTNWIRGDTVDVFRVLASVAGLAYLSILAIGVAYYMDDPDCKK